MRLPPLVALVLVVPALAHAQDEFSLPEFAHDAGVTAPPPVSAPPLLPSPQPAPSQPVVLREPRWAKVALSAVGVLAGWRDLYAGLELFIAPTFGTPQLTSDTRDVAGWQWMPGLEVAWSKLSGPVCAGSDFCGERWGGGATLRVGHAVGLAAPDGDVRVRRLLFGGVSVHGMFVNVPPAPLTQGSKWGELVLRARFGVQVGTAPVSATSNRGGFTVHLSGFAEGLIFNAVGDRFQLGVALGVAL